MLIAKTKKGDMSINLIVSIIIILISAGVILGLIILFKGNVEEKSLEAVCQASVAGTVKTAIDLGVTEVRWGSLACKTISKEVKGDRKEVKETLARKMARCWEMFYEGRQDVLAATDLKKLYGGSDCFTCYIIDTGEIEGGTIPISELSEYVTETKHYKVPGYTYGGYIEKHGGEGGAAVIFSDIKPKQLYGIAFITKSSDNNILTFFVGWSPLLDIYLFLTAERPISSIILADRDSLEKSQCVINYVEEKSGG